MFRLLSENPSTIITILIEEIHAFMAFSNGFYTVNDGKIKNWIFNPINDCFAFERTHKSFTIEKNIPME